MLALQERFCPSTKERLNEVLSRYEALMKGPKGQDRCAWIDKWRSIEDELRRAKALELNTLIDRFMDANSLVDEAYTATWRDRVEAGEVDFDTLVKAFYNNYRRTPAHPALTTRSAFSATLNDLSDVKKSVSSDPPELNESYELANPKCLISRRQLSQPPTRPFQDVWVDIIHASTPGFDGTVKLLHYYDYVTKLHIIDHLFKKSDINNCIPRFFEYVKTQFGFLIERFHIDDEQSIRAIERAHRTLTEKQRYMRIESKIPENLFLELWSTAAYLTNRTPLRSLNWKTPWQVLNEHLKRPNTKPILAHLRVLGSRAYVLDHKVPKGQTSKSVLYDEAKYELPRRDDLVVLDGSESPEIKIMTSVATGSVEKNQKKHTVDELPGQFPTPEITPELASQTTATDNASPDPGYQLNVELDHLFTTHPSSLNEPPRLRPSFKSVLEDICLLTKGRIIIFFYVDDIVILNRPEHHSEANEVVLKLKAKYEIRDLVKQYGLSTGSHVYSPLSWDASAYKPFCDGVAMKTEIKSFQACVGSLIYPAFMTCPDIAHAASLLARFMQNPSPFHSAEADRVICYLRDSKDLSLVYDSSISMNSLASFKAYSDAAYADDPTTRCSSEGYLFSLFGGPVDWKAARQSTIMISTTEAELLALSHAAKELYWWRRFFEQLGFC
ncbi:hypothetical protein VTO42DRAFT_4592 [Malbranchea cinnamomea]